MNVFDVTDVCVGKSVVRSTKGTKVLGISTKTPRLSVLGLSFII